MSERGAHVCPSCKHDAPVKISDPERLRPYREFYTSKFKALECPVCSAEWSVYYPGE